ncbi:MAG: 4Fe-4S binding protein [Planctomycetota bacterium]|jgi:polyferredoxin
MPEWLRRLEELVERASANIKIVDQALTGLEGSYVELLTVLALGLLAVIPVIVPAGRRQLYRHLNQIFGIAVFVFVVFTCLGVFGMIRNFHRGLGEIGRENVIALYYCSVPATVLVTSLLFGPTFCGWICPTGALQEFAYVLLRPFHRRRKREGYPFSRKILALTALIALIFLGWMAYLSATRVFFVEDASIYWSEVLVILLFVLLWKMRDWDRKLRRLRVLSFWIIAASAVAALRITSPVHFGFSKVYDPASVLATAMVFLAALAVPHVWCRYLCPWREAIAWAAKHSVRRLETDFEKCVHCGECTEACAVDAVRDGKVDRHECHMCFRCVDVCPAGAIGVVDRWRKEGCGRSCSSCPSSR